MPRLFYDKERRMRYWYDEIRDELVYENGERFPRPESVPRTILVGSTQVDPQQYQSPPGSDSGYEAASSSLEGAFGRLSVDGNNYRGTYQSSHQDYGCFAGPYPAQVYDREGIRYISAQSPEAQVQTLYAEAPKQAITDPTLFANGVKAHRKLIGTGGGESEPLYSTFKLQPASFFKLGRVFHVLWAEPAGANRTVVTSFEPSDRGYIPGRHEGEQVYSKVRRFVVVREGGQYCSALPIMSYGARGVGKPGVIKSEHAIIYTGQIEPQPMTGEYPQRGEEPMRKYAIRVVPDVPTDKLDERSRIDFGKVHTVQHNIKVKSFGMVHQKSAHDLVLQFGNVWLGPSTANASGSQAQASSRSGKAATKAGSSSGAARSSTSQGSRSVASVAGHRLVRRTKTRSNAGANARDDDDDDDDEEEDQEEDEDEDNAGEGSRTTLRRPGPSALAPSTTQSAQNVQAAQSARQAMHRLVELGYSSQQAFHTVAQQLSRDRNISYEAASQQLSAWFGEPTQPSAPAQPSQNSGNYGRR